MNQLNAAPSRRFTLLAVAFELALGVLALLLGWLIGPSVAQTVRESSGSGRGAALLIGTLTALPLFGALVLMDRRPLGILRDLQWIVRQQVTPLFRGASPGDLLLISLSAGVGEELLFRGYIQVAITNWLEPPWGVWLGIVAASLLFGLCHWLSLAYALLATVMGIVLSTLFAMTGNLWAPIAAHAVYDFLALCYLVRVVDSAAAGDEPRV